jgi:hypothetical protein
LFSPDDNKSGEQILFGEYPFWHAVFTILNHLKLYIVNELYTLIQAVFIGIADNSNDEIHEYKISDNKYEEPEEPC